jgi:hypothetical protein
LLLDVISTQLNAVVAILLFVITEINGKGDPGRAVRARLLQREDRGRFAVRVQDMDSVFAEGARAGSLVVYAHCNTEKAINWIRLNVCSGVSVVELLGCSKSERCGSSINFVLVGVLVSD